MNTLEALLQSSGSPAEYVGGYFERMTEVMNAVDTETVARVIEAVEEACAEDKAIFLIANGGSAGVASHFVNDLVPNTLVEGQPSFRAFSLTDNVASVTAVANDSGYEDIFSIQLKALMRPGDLVIVPAGSQHRVEAAEEAVILATISPHPMGEDYPRDRRDVVVPQASHETG